MSLMLRCLSKSEFLLSVPRIADIVWFTVNGAKENQWKSLILYLEESSTYNVYIYREHITSKKIGIDFLKI